MSPNRRIFLNVVATYGRSLYALAIGLFTARWVLNSLGEVDFGLYGVVGGLTAFIQFFNNLMSMAVVRFYGVSVGAANVAATKEIGVEECRKWFSVAFSLHTVVPLVLVLIGYPVGGWAVRNFLTIPADRVQACIWVWRCTCLSCLVGMMNVPFRAMYDAKQELAELTIYSFATTTLNFLFLAYMVNHPADWLAKYATWMCALSIVPQLIIGLRAFQKYPECRLRTAAMWDLSKIKQLVCYAGARMWTALSSVFSSQGQSILVNKYLGPAFNASMTVGGQVSSHASTLSSSISGAFWPAIANAAGEKDEEKVRRLSFRVCRLGTLMLLVFYIPLSLEVDEVLRLWLKNPPAFASQICIAIMFGGVCERITEGYWMAVMGLGRKVWYYSWMIGWAGFSSFFISFALLACGLRLWGICAAIALASIVTVLTRLYLGRRLVGFSVCYWARRVMLPIVAVAVAALLAGTVGRAMMEASFARICLTTVFANAVAVPCGWYFVLTAEEKAMIASKFALFRKRILE